MDSSRILKVGDPVNVLKKVALLVVVREGRFVVVVHVLLKNVEVGLGVLCVVPFVLTAVTDELQQSLKVLLLQLALFCVDNSLYLFQTFILAILNGLSIINNLFVVEIIDFQEQPVFLLAVMLSLLPLGLL